MAVGVGRKHTPKFSAACVEFVANSISLAFYWKHIHLFATVKPKLINPKDANKHRHSTYIAVGDEVLFYGNFPQRAFVRFSHRAELLPHSELA